MVLRLDLIEKKEPVVGYNLGLFAEGVTTIGSAKECDLIPVVSRKVAAVLEVFVRNSKLNSVQKRGPYRRLEACRCTYILNK
eukprot:TRINITY_DN16538_c0_g1_i1.p2 TRINITY_DN16538_c0_g1~~TRINITY_DN16538_c0_g1_i1.p2  ORF type:complete len:82 (-),score=8.40 TRINITY_DN16538_c0_g1_i1:349-594(-)